VIGNQASKDVQLLKDYIMKKIALLAAALAVAASPVYAAGFSLISASNYTVSGNVLPYCGTGSATNTGTNVSFSSGIVGTNVTITTLEDVPTGQAHAWNAHIVLGSSLCNTKFNVRAGSLAGGLTTAGTTGPDFVKSEDYSVAVTFGSNTNTKNASTLGILGSNVIAGGNPAVGDFKIDLTGLNPGKPLIAGLYADNLTVVMTPSL
jgi:hypothetical protein